MTKSSTIESKPTTKTELELAQIIIDTLNLEISVTDVDRSTPIYGQGFGLDSIDILEISLAISQRYGVKLRSDEKNNSKIFESLGSLNDHIQEYKNK
jgi:acyl carrier protein